MPKHDISPTQYYLGQYNYMLISAGTIKRLEASILVELQVNKGLNDLNQDELVFDNPDTKPLSEIPELTCDEEGLTSRNSRGLY